MNIVNNDSCGLPARESTFGSACTCVRVFAPSLRMTALLLASLEYIKYYL